MGTKKPPPGDSDGHLRITTRGDVAPRLSGSYSGDVNVLCPRGKRRRLAVGGMGSVRSSAERDQLGWQFFLANRTARFPLRVGFIGFRCRRRIRGHKFCKSGFGRPFHVGFSRDRNCEDREKANDNCRNYLSIEYCHRCSPGIGGDDGLDQSTIFKCELIHSLAADLRAEAGCTINALSGSRACRP